MQNNCNEILELYKEILSNKESFLDIGNINKNNIKNFLGIKKLLKNNIKKLKEIINDIERDKNICLEIYRNLFAGDKIIEDDFLDNITIPEKPKEGKWRLLYVYLNKYGSIDYDYIISMIGYKTDNIREDFFGNIENSAGRSREQKPYSIWVEDIKNSRQSFLTSDIENKSIKDFHNENINKIINRENPINTMTIDEYFLFIFFKFLANEDFNLDSAISGSTLFPHSRFEGDYLMCKINNSLKRVDVMTIKGETSIPENFPRVVITN